MKFIMRFLISMAFFCQLPILNATETNRMDFRLSAVLERARKGEEINVVFLGGSATWGANLTPIEASWRHKTMDWLSRQFPQANWNFVNAAIPGTGVELAAFRLRNEVMEKCVPDLLFVEFGIKEQGMTSELVFGGALEGVVRRVLQHNPRSAIVCVYSLSKHVWNLSKEGHEDTGIEIAKKVVSHYGIDEVDIRNHIGVELGASRWEQADFWSDGTNLDRRGHELYANAIAQHLQRAADTSNFALDSTLDLPQVLFTDQFVNASIWLPDDTIPGWEKEGNPESFSGRFAPNVLRSSGSDEEFVVDFQGRMFGIVYLVSEDTGSIDVSIDGKEDVLLSSYREHGNKNMVYTILNYKLRPGAHTARIRFFPAPDHPNTFTIFGIMSETQP